ncbi:unnamed protein product [Ixodes persulcatus]
MDRSICFRFQLTPIDRSHVRMLHRRGQSREQRLLAIQQAAAAASRGHHLSRDMKTLLGTLSPAERKLVAIKHNLQVTPGQAVPFRRMRSQSVVFQPDPARRSPLVVRARSLSVSDAPERPQLHRTHAAVAPATRLTDHEEDDRFRTYTRQVYVLFATLAAIVAAAAYYTFFRIHQT